jgi:hypothetical protein
VSHLLRHGTSVLKVISERHVILSSECRAFGEGAITHFKRLLRSRPERGSNSLPPVCLARARALTWDLGYSGLIKRILMVAVA